MESKPTTSSGLFWSFVSQGGKQFFQFCITALMARVLLPSDYGLVAMALVFTNFSTVFVDLGLGAALIQKKEIDDADLSTVFWINVIIGAAVSAIFILCSPSIASFYGNSIIAPIVIVAAAAFFIASLSLVQQSVLTRNMLFKSLAKRDLLAVLTSGLVGLWMAYSGFGVWSLVFQWLLFNVVDGILLWSFSPWRPSFTISLHSVKRMSSFSMNVAATSFVNYFARNLDSLLIGKVLGARDLGLYSFAYKLMMYPLYNISRVFGKVLFPALSRIQHDSEKVQTTYLKMIKAVSLITFPMMFGLLALAPEVINTIYGPKWTEAILLIRILCVCGAVQSIGTLIGNIFLSQGKPDLDFKIQIISVLLVIASVFLGNLWWGIKGIAILYAVQSIVVVHVSFGIAHSLIKLKYKRFYKTLIPSYASSIFMAISLYMVVRAVHISSIYSLALVVFFGMALYVIILTIIQELQFKNNRIYLPSFDKYIPG